MMKSHLSIIGRLYSWRAGAYALALGLGAILPLTADEPSAHTPVWQIGNFDRSSMEFWKQQPKKVAIYDAGKSLSATDWPSFQMVGADAVRTVRFSLEASRAPGYRLHVAVLIGRPGVPGMRLGINGHEGLFFLHPELDYTMGDSAGGGHPGYSHADVTVDIPGDYFQAGENQLTLTAVSLADEPVPGAGWVYDALELDPLTAAPDPTAVTAQIEPTLFYKAVGKKLSEQIDVFVRHEKRAAGTIDLEIGGRSYHQDLKEEGDFGEERVEFQVPELAGSTPARLVITRDGRKTEVQAAVVPARKWTIYVVPQIHLDIGYTDYQAKVGAIHARSIDEALDLIDQHPDFNYSLDGEWGLEQFMATRSPADQQRAIKALQKGRLFCPANYVNLLTGFPTAEALIRSLYPSANFSREHDTPFDYATITDVPSYSASYPSILASAGIKYLTAGSNNDRAPIIMKGRLHEKSPMWWVGPDGQKILLWYSFVYRQVHSLFGLPPQVCTGEQMLPLFMQSYDKPSYRSHAVMLYGTQGENRDLYPQQAELVQRWNAKHAYPHLQYSGVKDAMIEIARQCGDSIPTVRGDGGPYWEDGLASDAYYATLERSTEARGPSAEKLATAATILNSRISNKTAALTDMWRNIAGADEHTFDSSNSASDPGSDQARKQRTFKESFSIRAHEMCDQIMRASLSDLADVIPAPSGSIVVFNPLNWTRDGLVSFDLRRPAQIVDVSSGKVVPVRVLDAGTMHQKVEFLAQAVPAVGYKVYELRRGDKEAEKNVPASNVLENKYYRLELDPASGAVASLYDKELQRELVDTKNPYRFGQYLYVTGGDSPPLNNLLYFGAVNPKTNIQVHGAEGGRLVSIEQTPDGVCAHLTCSAVNTPQIDTEIRLSDREKKVTFTTDLKKTETLQKEGVYFAFPFAIDHPQFRFEVQNGWIDPAKDMLPGAGLEWFSVQHWVSVENEGVSATVLPLDAGLVTLGDINRGAWPSVFGDRKSTIFSYVMNNYWHTNCPASQGGNFRFRYVVTSAPHTDPVDISRRGWEEMTPLEVNEIQDQDKSWTRPPVLDGKQGSLMTLHDPALLLQTWKFAEDGKGTVLRLLDLGGAERKVTVETPLINLASVHQTDAVERNLKILPLNGPHAFQVEVHPHEIITVRLAGSPVLSPPIIHPETNSSEVKPGTAF